MKTVKVCFLAGLIFLCFGTLFAQEKNLTAAPNQLASSELLFPWQTYPLTWQTFNSDCEHCGLKTKKNYVESVVIIFLPEESAWPSANRKTFYCWGESGHQLWTGVWLGLAGQCFNSPYQKNDDLNWFIGPLLKTDWFGYYYLIGHENGRASKKIICQMRLALSFIST